MIPRWSLPEHFEDVLPDEAERVERLRRDLLDLFRSHGYDLVMPPLIEYVESLLTGTGRDLDLRTFKLVDQLSGRMLGLRADITPQAARIDAHLLGRRGVTRLCYAGPVVHTVPSSLARTRESLQAGAELFGDAGSAADIEIQRLMLRALHVAGIGAVHLAVGHVGIVRGLLARARPDADTEDRLHRALQAKDRPTISQLTRGFPRPVRAAVQVLADLNGGREVIAAARRLLPAIPEVRAALVDLARTADAVGDLASAVHVDLAELRGYRYHSGLVFAAYAVGSAEALARGGRYDDVGKAFGRGRPATGFSLDLREVAMQGPQAAPVMRVLAPRRSDPGLARVIERLRARGVTVIADLPGHAATRDELACSGELVLERGRWLVRARRGRRAPRR